MNQAAEQIKDLLSMQTVLERYGFQLNERSFMRCPFHEEKTASFRVYDNGKRFKCFGCGESGSVIDFTMKLFGISFSQAVLRLNEDFGLGLTDQKPDLRKRRELAVKMAENARRKREREAYLEQLVKEHRRLWQDYLNQRPATPAEPLRPAFVQALHRLEYVRYLLSDGSEQDAKDNGRNNRIYKG